MRKCEYCEGQVKKRSKELLALCKAKSIMVCSIECYNNYEAEGLYNDKLD